MHYVATSHPTEDKGELDWGYFRPVCVERDCAARTLILSQELYINTRLLKRYGQLLDEASIALLTLLMTLQLSSPLTSTLRLIPPPSILSQQMSRRLQGAHLCLRVACQCHAP